MTNNPAKTHGLEDLGINISNREPIVIEANDVNKEYLHTKAVKMGHQLDE